MLNKLFARRAPSQSTAPMITNAAGGSAKALSPQAALAQVAMTGTLNDTFYADATTQLDELLACCAQVEPSFVAKTALVARQSGRMKDTPVLLLAWLAVHDGALFEQIFDRVIDNGAQLRNLVQVLRSGVVGRNCLGSRAKRLVQRWLEQASDRTIVQAMVGKSPSLADVIKMAHPRASSIERSALYGHVIGKCVNPALLPQVLRELAAFRADPTAPVPNVPFQMLTSTPLTTAHWTTIARQASWTMTRMNLNTFARHGVFEDEALVELVARRLADPVLVGKARAFPYQLLTSFQAATTVPAAVRDALRQATELAVANVPALRGSVAVAVDVSGSMQSPVTGYRTGATSVTRCVDVAGLMAASILAKHPGAMVLPFNDRVRPWARPRRNTVIDTAQALANLLGGGTAVSAPIVELNRLGVAPDTVLIVSDNQSWADFARGRGQTETERAWAALRRRNPSAKLVCIDLQPYSNTQVSDDPNVLNVGGFSDAVWSVVAAFTHGAQSGAHWVAQIEAVELTEQ